MILQIKVGDSDVDELCHVVVVKTHLVRKAIYFLRFERHIPGKTCSVMNVPVSLTGMYGCPGHLKEGHIELAMPTVRVEVHVSILSNWEQGNCDYRNPNFSTFHCSRGSLIIPRGLRFDVRVGKESF